MINQINWNENKILYTHQVVKWMQFFDCQKDFILISPMTKNSDLFNLNRHSILYEMFFGEEQNFFDDLINENEIIKIEEKINQRFKFSLVESKFSNDKLVKLFFKINDQYVKIEDLKSILEVLNKYTKKIINIILVDWGVELLENNFNMLNLHFLTSNLLQRLHWGNLERLVMLDWDIPTEIIDKNKFKDWLELETKTVLTIKDINDYFSDKATMTTFLIAKALKKFKN